jgi:hypothetical protein
MMRHEVQFLPALSDLLGMALNFPNLHDFKALAKIIKAGKTPVCKKGCISLAGGITPWALTVDFYTTRLQTLSAAFFWPPTALS